jgi:hypothetical protein
LDPPVASSIRGVFVTWTISLNDTLTSTVPELYIPSALLELTPVTVGAVTSIATLLSVAVEALLLLPAGSWTVLSASVGTSVPAPDTAVAASVHVMLSAVSRSHVIPVAVPLALEMSAVVNVPGTTA